jgi:acyl dehydratase
MAAPAMDLAAYEALVGRDLPQPEQVHYEVTRDTIRHFAYCIPDFNALYLDADYALGTRWRSIVAPPGYLYGHGYSTWLRTFPGLRDSEGRELESNDNAEENWDFLRPVRPGDTVYSRGTITGVEARTGKRIGDFALVRTEMRYLNQRAEAVATCTARSFRFNSLKVGGGGGMGRAYPPMPPGQTTRNIAAAPEYPGSVPTPERERHPQRYFEDVTIGEAIAPWTVGPITVLLTGKFNACVLARGSDAGGPRQSGAIPDAFAPGPMRTMWLGTMLTRWGGPDSWVTRIAQQNREFVLVGFKVVCKGEVTGKSVADGRHLVDCRVTCDSELGFVTNVGTAQIELPSRADSA